jgi:hypothetical protein
VIGCCFDPVKAEVVKPRLKIFYTVCKVLRSAALELPTVGGIRFSDIENHAAV